MRTKEKQGQFVMNFFKTLTVLFVLVLVGCGDGGGSDSDDVTDPVDPDAPLVPSSLVLTTSLPTGTELAQGGTTTITATVYNNGDGSFADDGTPVTFTATAGIIIGTVPTVSGKATATYSAGSAGGAVTISAQASAKGFFLDAENDVNFVSDDLTLIIASGPAAWIELVSISPERLGLKGTGFDEVGLLTFNIKDASGNPVTDGTPVDFSLESPTGGGEYVFPTTALTAEGQVEVSLVSGVVPGVATVTATTNPGESPVSTESKVTMGYGKTDQLHFSIFYDKLNDPGQIEFNITNTINAAVADRYSNPVPAGTPVYFASECGIVSLDSNVTNPIGLTSVDWVTANPVATDGYCTTIAWTEGEEAYIDSNGNGAYDLGETHTPIGEPYIDANENGVFDAATETFFDLDENGAYTPADAVWDGNTFVWVDGTTRYSDYTAAPVISPATFDVEAGGFQDFVITIADNDGGPLPAGTTATVSDTCNINSILSGDTSITIPDAVYPGDRKTEFTVRLSSRTSTAGSPSPCALTVDVAADVNGPNSTTINGQLD